MSNYISCSGMYKDDKIKIEVTLMNSTDYTPPIIGHLIYDVSFYSYEKLNVMSLEYFLSCNDNIYSYVDVKDLAHYKFPVEESSYPFRTSVTVLFKNISQVHYMDTQLLFYYRPYRQIITINLNY